MGGVRECSRNVKVERERESGREREREREWVRGREGWRWVGKGDGDSATRGRVQRNEETKERADEWRRNEEGRAEKWKRSGAMINRSPEPHARRSGSSGTVRE